LTLLWFNVKADDPNTRGGGELQWGEENKNKKQNKKSNNLRITYTNQ